MSLLIDILAAFSLVGIWPRFIEPYRLKVTHLTWILNTKDAHLDGLKIVHVTDLHFHARTSEKFLNKISHTISQLKPDLVLFTGDFLCYSCLEKPEVLKAFLCDLKAPLGAFCTFGNHDYAAYVTLNREGIYDLRAPINPFAGILMSLRTLIAKSKTGTKASKTAISIPLHASLCALLQGTPFKLLENTTVTLPIGLNLTGLGDLALGRCLAQKAFIGYNHLYPGIILSHNPDSFPQLLDFPGDFILSGHTHGEQIHFPWPKLGREISQKLARLQNREYTRGLFTVGNKKLYVNRGLGCHKPFRLFSPPEICLIRALRK